MKYRLGLDLGTNSIGWTLLELNEDNEPIKIIKMGSRVFSDGRDPKSKTSNAVARREARGIRRMRDRGLRRSRNLLNFLKKHGFFPKTQEEGEKLKNLNPYELRTKGLYGKLSPFEFGRAIMHLAKRRGFKSNRKDGNESKDSSFLEALSRFETKVLESSYQTMGEYLYHLGDTKRNKGGHDLTPTRKMIEEEFDCLFQKQKEYYSEIFTKSFEDKLRLIIFHQRPLKDCKELVGKCLIYGVKEDGSDGEKRLARYHILFQKFRILQNIAQLKIIKNGKSRDLTIEEKDKLYEKLMTSKQVTFDSMRKTLLKLSPDSLFNLESERRKKLEGNQTDHALSGKNFYGKDWFKLTEELRGKIIDLIHHTEDHETLIQELEKLGISSQKAKSLASFNPNSFESGYARFGEKALTELTEMMRNRDYLPLQETLEALKINLHYYNPSEIRKELPYYGEVLPESVVKRPFDDPKTEQGEYGRLSNPTVHIVLGQLRKIINKIIEKWGNPHQIVVEVARGLKQNKKQRSEIESQQKKNQQNNEKIKKELKECSYPVNREHIQKYKLWEEVQKICPFTGKSISMAKLFSHDIHIEHLLPFSQSLDDSMANKTVCFASANKEKGNRTPFEAFGNKPCMMVAMEKLPRNKRWRFQEDAREKMNKSDNWLARQLVDTHFMSKMAKKYLAHICPAPNIYTVRGAITAKVRYHLGLNNLLGSKENMKDRSDHRHHAIDALVLSLISRSFLLQAQNLMKGKSDFVFPLPWEGFREDVKESVESILTSHRPRHIEQGALLDETARGEKRTKTIAEKNYPLDKTGEVKASFVRIEHGKGKKFYKYYKKNTLSHLLVWELPDGTFEFQGVYLYDLMTKKWLEKKPHREAKIKVRIYKNDVVKIEGELRKITVISPANRRFCGIGVNEVGAAKNIAFSEIKKGKLEKVYINEIGEVFGD